jgi:hypothetical protein
MLSRVVDLVFRTALDFEVTGLMSACRDSIGLQNSQTPSTDIAHAIYLLLKAQAHPQG